MNSRYGYPISPGDCRHGGPTSGKLCDGSPLDGAQMPMLLSGGLGQVVLPALERLGADDAELPRGSNTRSAAFFENLQGPCFELFAIHG